MRRLVGLLGASFLIPACDGATVSAPESAPAPAPGVERPPSDERALVLRPRLQLVGLGDVHEAVSVSRLTFDAEVVVLPAERGDVTGDAVAISFEFEEGRATTRLLDGHLRLPATGAYDVYVRVRPGDDEDDASVTVGGALAGAALQRASDEAPRHKAGEPAPVPADEAADEPAPVPADEPANPADEPAPVPADEPAPVPADEPAPVPADEPAPVPADEPAPVPADEPAPVPAREKPEEGIDGFDTDIEHAEPVFVRSRRPYDFYAGVVEVQPGDTELLVTWDVRTWLRSVLAEQLGIQRPEVSEVPRPGFADVPSDFRIESR